MNNPAQARELLFQLQRNKQLFERRLSVIKHRSQKATGPEEIQRYAKQVLRISKLYQGIIKQIHAQTKKLSINSQKND